MQQNEDEIDEYLARLQTKAERCDFNANIEDLANEYPDRFQSIGNFPEKQKIYINKNTTPVVQPQRKYPVHLKRSC